MATGIGGEVLWWCPSLDDASVGSSSVVDLSGGGYTGTLYNMEAGDWLAETSNGGIRCLDFGGTDEYLGVTPFAPMNNIANQTISFWGYRSLSTRTLSFGKRNGTTWNNVSVWSDSNLYLLIGVNKSGNVGYTGTGWHHYCGVFDGTQSTDSTKFKLYVDGNLQTLAFSGSPMPTTTPNMADGLTANLSAGSFGIGYLDDMRIFNRSLTLAEVTSLASMRGYQPTAPSNTLAPSFTSLSTKQALSETILGNGNYDVQHIAATSGPSQVQSPSLGRGIRHLKK